MGVMHDDEPTNSDENDTRLHARLADAARSRVREQPLRAVGGAVATGFVLGSTRPLVLARRALTLGLRVLLRRVAST